MKGGLDVDGGAEREYGVREGEISPLPFLDSRSSRCMPYSALVQANAQQVGAAVYGQFVYGPTVDGDFVPALPGELLLHGQYPKNLKVMVGHNADEVGIMPFLLRSGFVDQL